MAEKRNSGKKNTGTSLNISDPNVYEAVRKRAFELYCQRGSAHGNDLKDWLEAEKQVRREMENRR